MIPPYDIQNPCSHLSWDDVTEDWYCSTTRTCLRLSCECPLIEVLTKDVLCDRIKIDDVSLALRSEVFKRVESNSEPVQMFLF